MFSAWYEATGISFLTSRVLEENGGCLMESLMIAALLKAWQFPLVIDPLLNPKLRVLYLPLKIR